jgi:hypothetical protein
MAEVEGTGAVSVDPTKWWVVALYIRRLAS